MSVNQDAVRMKHVLHQSIVKGAVEPIQTAIWVEVKMVKDAVLTKDALIIHFFAIDQKH